MPGLGLLLALAATPLIGVWSGDRTVLTLTANGGHIQQDCATGALAGPISPDARGRFKANGLMENHAGSMPQREVASAGTAVRYEGKVTGRSMRLTIRSSGVAPRTVTLAPGRSVKLIRCL